MSVSARAAAGNQKGEANVVGGPMFSPKCSVCEHAAHLLCSSPEEEACIC